MQRPSRSLRLPWITREFLPTLSLRALLIFFLTLSGVTAGEHKVRVSDPALVKELEKGGARLVESYGSFHILQADAVAISKAHDDRIQLMDELDVIQLQAGRLNTRELRQRSKLGISDARPDAGTRGRRLHLVQFAGPIKPDWLQELQSTGVEVVDYVPANAYLVYGSAPALARMQSWCAAARAVQWDGPYLSEHKVHPRARMPDAKGRIQAAAVKRFAIQLLADADANALTLAEIEHWKAGDIDKDVRILRYRNVIVSLPTEAVAEIGMRPDVISIQPWLAPVKRDERLDQIMAGNILAQEPSGPGYLDWLASKGFNQEQFDASGFVVDVSDSGIDNGTIVPGHFGLYELGDPWRAGRVAYVRLVGSANPGSTLRGCDGHGALNAHIIAGYNGFLGWPYTDSAGFSYGLGVCPFVRVGSSVVFDPDRFTFPDYPALVTAAYNSGARISNNSWGASSGAAYDIDAQTFDTLVRDAGAAGRNRQMVIVFAAGNDGPAARTVESPGTAKNIITVGASENVRSFTGFADYYADRAGDMTEFSSRGPCADGRKKPDVVAPGVYVTGGVAQGIAATNGVGQAIACFDGSGVSGPSAASAYYPYNQEFYTVSSGTSHAVPAVSGACALLRQHFINDSLPPPSPAMTKACLMNSARYLTGSDAGDDLWSPAQGMGCVDLGTLFDGVPRILRDQVAEEKFTGTGETRSVTGFVHDPTLPLRVTVAWTDAPGSTIAEKALVNDLDLTVAIGGRVYRGNVFNGPWSVPGGQPDGLNNVESVFLPAGQSNSFTVSVTAANVAADAITNGGLLPQQDFALVIYNGTVLPTPVIIVSEQSIVSESYVPSNGACDPGETVVVNVTLQNVGTADATNLVVTLLESGGIEMPGGAQNYGVLVAGGPSATQVFTFSTSGSCGQTNIATFRLEDDGLDLGCVTMPLPLGNVAAIYGQRFDGPPMPPWPPGWSSSASGTASRWVRTRFGSDSMPYHAFVRGASRAGTAVLLSPPIPLPMGLSRLTFRSRYDLECDVGGAAFDGGVLEMRIGSGEFEDVLSAGGRFVTGGYNASISDSYQNPLGGREAWSGDSGGYKTTIVDLPASAAGQTAQFRWCCGTDSGNASPAWRIDSVRVDGYWCWPDVAPPPPFTPAPASYSGLFYEADAVRHRRSGLLTLRMTAGGSYSGTMQMGRSRYPFSGVCDAFGAISNRLSLPGIGAVTLRLQVERVGNRWIEGVANGDGWAAEARLTASGFNARTNVAPYGARSTWIAPGHSDPAVTNVPFGDGCGSISVTADGVVRLIGTLSDGSVVSQVTRVAADGSWPFYVPLYGGKGQGLGWMQFTELSSQSGLSGWLSWIKPPIANGRYYPAGFDCVITNVTGSPYNAAVAPVSGFSEGLVQLASSELASALSGSISIGSNNRVVNSGPGKLTFRFNPGQGLFNGTIVDGATLKVIAFKGALLQDRKCGSGYFLGSSHSGRVTVGPQ